MPYFLNQNNALNHERNLAAVDFNVSVDVVVNDVVVDVIVVVVAVVVDAIVVVVKVVDHHQIKISSLKTSGNLQRN